MRGKRSTFITTLAVIFSVISLVSCFGVLGISNSIQGVSIKEEEIWEVVLDNVTEIVMDEYAIEVLKQPSLDKYKINYGIRLNRAQSTAQFAFIVKNEGNVDAVVKDIKITGINGYENNLKVTLTNLAIGDVINAESMVQVKVVNNYDVELNDEMLVPQIINLDNIEIDIDLEKVE